MELLTVDHEILTVIAQMRREHHACTGASVAQALKLSRTWVFQRCSLLREAGYITWTAMPGSLRCVTPVAVNTAETLSSPQDDTGSSIADPTVTEPAGPITPTTPTRIPRVKRPPHEITPRKRIPRDPNPYKSPHQTPPYYSTDKPVRNKRASSKSFGMTQTFTNAEGMTEPNADNQTS